MITIFTNSGRNTAELYDKHILENCIFLDRIWIETTQFSIASNRKVFFKTVFPSFNTGSY